MKEINISRYLNMELTEFLGKVGARDGNTSWPCHVYVSHEDAAKLKRANRRILRKERPYLNKNLIDGWIGQRWLTYGPSEVIGKAIRPGCALVDVDAIATDIAKDLEESRESYTCKITAVADPLTFKQKLYNFITLNWI